MTRAPQTWGVYRVVEDEDVTCDREIANQRVVQTLKFNVLGNSDTI